MNWKLKALIHNSISYLPSKPSYTLHYLLQRRFGGLKNKNPVNEILKGIDICNEIINQNQSPRNKIFFELGTGRIALAPLAYWLMGAEKIITVDLNPYLKEELIKESLQYISKHKEEIRSLFGILIDEDRWDRLLLFIDNTSFEISKYFKLCRITYIAPGDAANTALPLNSIDYHTSSTVFEHIPKDILKAIIIEGNRMIRKDGLFIHDIDYSDHFSHSDNKISAINFLQYSDKKWDKYAGNRYMYMNRLRHDDFLDLFQNEGHHILNSRLKIDSRSQDLLEKFDFPLNNQFKDKPNNILSISRAWITSRKSTQII